MAVKELYGVGVVRTIDGVAANADTSGLSIAKTGHLPDCFVSQRSGSGNDPYSTRLVDIARHDADLALTRRNHTWTVRTNQPGIGLQQLFLNLGHVVDGYAFRDGDDQFDPSIKTLQN